ncbi:MAG: Tol-Pal system beta propeller repeat protein TolB [Thermodesulfovibrionales bacterium]
MNTHVHAGRRTGITLQPLRLLAAVLLAALFLVPAAAQAKVYIDITSPSAKKLPIAIYDFQGVHGREISEIIREDLTFTGLFQYIDKASYIEPLSQPFNSRNWTPLGIEAVLKGTVSSDKGLSAEVSLYDAFESKEVFRRRYATTGDQVRALAHEIANDVYRAVTGMDGVFKTRIAFVTEDEGQKTIAVMDWDGHQVRKMGLRSTLVLGPHWSPDGNRLIYSSERGRQWGLYLLDFSRMTERRVFVSRGTNMAGDFFPKGDAVAFSSSREGTPDIYTLSLANESVKRLTSTYGIDVSPAVSPDGSLIAFVSDRGGSPQVYVMHSDGSGVRRITFEGSYNTAPSWAPKGDRIVFSCRRGKNQICLVKPDGSELVQLTEQGNNENPSFSPDGRLITFSSDRDGSKGIYIMRANGENQKRVSQKGLKATAPRWSPN